MTFRRHHQCSIFNRQMADHHDSLTNSNHGKSCWHFEVLASDSGLAEYWYCCSLVVRAEGDQSGEHRRRRGNRRQQ